MIQLFPFESAEIIAPLVLSASPALSCGSGSGHTKNTTLYSRVAARLKNEQTAMKTAVSIPDDLFEKVERFARRARRSRSEICTAALRDYLARRAPDEVTEAINKALDQVGDSKDDFGAAAARRILERTEW